MKNFAIIGTGGYIAPRHLRAIRETGNRLLAACDTRDSVGILDSHSHDVQFFTDPELFDLHITSSPIDYLSVCTPNHLHAAHAQMGLRAGADVICEKPLVVDPRRLDDLAAAEAATGRRVYSVLQLRLHPTLLALRDSLAGATRRHKVTLSYITARGPWYDASWKGREDLSGGIPTNIGIHFFDLLVWLFGKVLWECVETREPRRWGGRLELERADVDWFLSINAQDLPVPGVSTFREIEIDGKRVEFSEGFTDLHTATYQNILAGRGFGLEDCRPAIELVDRLRYKHRRL